MFQPSPLNSFPADMNSPYYRHQALSYIVQQVQRIYVVVQRAFNNQVVLTRVDIRPALLDSLRGNHDNVFPSKDEALALAHSLPILPEPACYIVATTGQQAINAWMNTLAQPGCITVDTLYRAASPALRGDDTTSLGQLCVDLAIALRICSPGDTGAIKLLVNIDGDNNTCPLALVEHYRHNLCELEFKQPTAKDTPRQPVALTLPDDADQCQIVQLIAQALDDVVTVVERDDIADEPVMYRVSVKDSLLKALSAPIVRVHALEHDITELAETMDIVSPDTSVNSMFPLDEVGLDEWMLSFNRPGCMMLDDVFSCAEEALLFDSPSMFVTLCIDLARALRMVENDEQETHLANYCEARADGNDCAYVVLAEYQTHLFAA